MRLETGAHVTIFRVDSWQWSSSLPDKYATGNSENGLKYFVSINLTLSSTALREMGFTI